MTRINILSFVVVLGCLVMMLVFGGRVSPVAAQGAGLNIEKIDLPIPPGERSVQRLIILADGKLYGVATGSQGRIRYFRHDPASGGVQIIAQLPNQMLEPREVLDPEAGFTWDPTGKAAYSIGPKGKLLKHTMLDGGRKTQAIGQVSGIRPFEHKPEAKVEGFQRSRAMFFDKQGNVYTAGKGGHLFRYSPGTGKLQQLEAQLPAIRGREPWASLDAAVVGPNGLVYGGTFDGYIFTLDLSTMTVVNLGKPLRQQRILGLVFQGGKLYGIGGEEQGLPRTFAYNPQAGGFELGSTIHARIGHVGAMVGDKKARIYFGTTGRLGNLYAWEVR